MDKPSQQTTEKHPHEKPAHFPLDGQGLQRLTEAGFTWLKTNQQIVNSLNVFPVPDGDTGTNMVLTMQAALDEINQTTEHNAGKAAHAIAHGSLMGARGNSGVILSQLWRGFARALDNQELIDGESLVRAFAMARDTAYKGVVRPVEGTILTVAKDVAAAAEKAYQVTQDPFEILEIILPAADASVQRTPELLPVLKDAGVVDSGGKGLFYLLEGMVRYIQGQSLETTAAAIPISAMKLEETREAIEPGQDFEWVIDFEPLAVLNLDAFYHRLEQLGTSIQLGEGEGMYRLHIHVPTTNRDIVLPYIDSLAKVKKAALENLAAQMEEIERTTGAVPLKLAEVKDGQIAAIAVSPGAGIGRVFADLGAAGIVEGGQTMNPSTQELLAALEVLPTDKVVVLPNNKNIIPTAEAAAQLSKKQVAVIPTRTVPQGLAAMMRLAPEGDFDSIVEEMREAIGDVQTGEVTTATRSVEMDDVVCKEGEIIVLYNGKLVFSAPDLTAASLGLMEKAGAENYELVTLFYGNHVTSEEAETLAGLIQEKYPNLEIQVLPGEQPHYHFIVSIE